MSHPFPNFSSPSDRRDADRASVSIEADLRRAGRTPFKIYVRDISRTGCRGETLTRIGEGDRVWLTLPGFAAIEGLVRWSTPRSFGIEWPTRCTHRCLTISASVTQTLSAKPDSPARRFPARGGLWPCPHHFPLWIH
ncbi:MAG: PilZ domain-containing protein [Sphingopyxis sp.]